MTDRFSEEALNWDNNADINLINQNITDSILPSILSSNDKVLEVGCGTGLLSFRYYRHVKSWFGIDTSKGMIDMFSTKIPHDAGEKVAAKEMYLTSPSQLDTMYEYAVSAMTFHHIPDMGQIIHCLARCVTKGLVVVDYAQWDGSSIFHPPEKMVGVERHGLDADEMTRLCRDAGFQHVETSIGFTLTLNRDGKDVQFPFLVVHARHAT